MTDMTRTLKMISDCDDEVHFERQVKRELLRLHDLLGKANAMARVRATRIEELEAQLYAVGAGGVGVPVQPEHNSNESAYQRGYLDGMSKGRRDVALEQPQGHATDAGNMAPAGWKLVPVEPTDDMLYDIQEFSHILPPRGKRIWAHMLAAAPQPPTTEQSSAVQPQGEQEPFAWISPRALEWGTRQSEKVVKLTCKAQPEYDFTEPLYTHPQPQVEQEPVAWTKPNWQSDPWATAVMDEQKKRDVTRNDGTPISKFSAAHTIPLYTHPQNLRCKSNQARLATLWGYVKPQPKRAPLTDEQMWKAWAVASGEHNASAAVKRRITRAIERAHGIGGEA